jgi:predicted ATPase
VHAAVLARQGQHAVALPMFEQSLSQARATGEIFALAEVHRLYAEALMRLGPDRVDEARRQLAAGAEIAERQGANGWKIRLSATFDELESAMAGVAGHDQETVRLVR